MTDYRMADNANQYRSPRRAPISGRVVLHDTGSLLDRIGADLGAENSTRFMETDDGPHSYHEIGDTDSEILLLPDHVEAFGAKGGVNWDAWHICIGCHPNDLDIDDPATFILIDYLARRSVAFWLRHGFDPLKARWLSADDGRTFGVLHHGDLQGDRSDAWSQHPQREQLDALFMARVAHHAGSTPSPQPSEEDVMHPVLICYHAKKKGHFLVEGSTVKPVNGEADLAVYRQQCQLEANQPERQRRWLDLSTPGADQGPLIDALIRANTTVPA